MQRRTALGFAALIGITTAPRASPDVEAARRAALDWLALVDAADATASWQQAASVFRQALSVEQWRQAATAARTPLGRVDDRSEQSATATTTLPGAPDGRYVVFRFRTRFAHKQAAVETLTVVLDSDGSWRASGYFIR